MICSARCSNVSLPPGGGAVVAARPLGSGQARPADVNSQDASVMRLGETAGCGEGEERTLEADAGRVAAPQQPEHIDGLVSSPALCSEVDADGGSLAGQHAQADRQKAHPAARNHVDGGEPFGEATGWL